MGWPRIVVAVAAALVAGASSASADPVTYAAPAVCPERGAVLARIEQRLGGALAPDAPTIAIKIWYRGSELVVRVDARAVAGKSALRVLHGTDCIALAEAATLIVARIARESGQTIEPRPGIEAPSLYEVDRRRRAAHRAARRAAVRRARTATCPHGTARLEGIDACLAVAAPEDAPVADDIVPAVDLAATAPAVTVPASASGAPSTRVAAVTPARADLDDAPERDQSRGLSVREASRAEARSRWGGGISVLGLSGVGALPEVNLGLEVSAYVRREQHFASLGVSRWVPQTALSTGGSVEIKLDTLVARAGWGPSRLPLRAWGLAEYGAMDGESIGLATVRRGSARWVALGAGFGVAWQMSSAARVLGTFEVAVPLSRGELQSVQWSTIHTPAVAAARAAFGLEVGWR